MLGADFDDRMTPWRQLTRATTSEARRSPAQQVLAEVADEDPLAQPENGRVLVVGDVHGNAHYLRRLVEQSAEQGIGLILQLGDTFGTRADTAEGTMELLSDACTTHGVRFLWLEGNHDRHVGLLDRLPIHPPSGLHPCRPNVWHLPRGHSWTWGGVRWSAIGGAVSVDASQRTLGDTWFTEEELTDEQADRCIEQIGRTDVLLTHDRPAWVELALGLTPGSWWQHVPGFWSDGDFYRSQAHQERLDRVVSALRPKLHLHGHLHRRYTLTTDETPWGERCRVDGLSHEGYGPSSNALGLPCAPDLDALLAEPGTWGDAR